VVTVIETREEASMTQHLSVDAAPTTGTPERKRENRPVAVWPLGLAAAIIAVGAVVCGFSLTPDQRIQAYLQSGMFP
jgi:hypothetical protein